MGGMATDYEPPNELQDPEWLDFESLLSELARIAKSDISFDRLLRALLDHAVHMLAAAGGAVWLGSPSDHLHLECQLKMDAIADPNDERVHKKLLDFARADGDTLVVPPGVVTIGAEVLENPTDFTLLIAPLRVDQDVVGLFEVAQRTSVSAAALRGNQRLLSLVSELAADQLRRRELRKLRDEQVQARQFEDFISRVHGSLDLRTVGYELVNAGRDFVECDRVSIAIRKGRRYRLIAVSSVDSIERRSSAVRCLEDLATRVARANEIVWSEGKGDEGIAPQIGELLTEYFDLAHPRTIGLLPLAAPQQQERPRLRRPTGVMIVEQFKSALDYTNQARAQRIAGPSACALVNALRYQSLPTLPFARNRNRPDAQRVVSLSILAALLAAVGVISWLLFIPMDFNIHAEGELQPEKQLFVFAPIDAQVESIAVQHGDHVAENDILLSLHSPDLDRESQRIKGELSTTQKRITAIESAILQLSSKDKLEENRFSQLAAEQEELRQQSENQQRQLSLLQEEHEKLVLHSPIAGQVLTWNLEQLLADRPVQRGQSLLSVADLNGPWVGELKVPDDKIGHVLEAEGNSKQLPVTFQLATNRGIDYQGEIRRISSRTETSLDNRAIVRVSINIDETTIGDLRPGATIFADIHCGRRSAAYVLFYDLYDAVRNWIRF